jgi:hypothetical protein
MKIQQKIIISLIIFIAVQLKLMAQPKVSKPTFNNFQTINTKNTNQKQIISSDNPFSGTQMPLGATAADIENKVKLQAMQQMNVMPRNNKKQGERTRQLEEFKIEEAKDKYNSTLAHFQYYLNQLLKLDPNRFSITEAVYLSEAAYYEQPYSHESFIKAIQQRANFVKQLLEQEGMSLKNGYAVHYGIQKLFSQNPIIRQKNNKQIRLRKIEYDFEDFFGDNDYTKMFVTKLLQTNSGQCRSMPLLYLCIAEQLQTKAWLSLAPQHSFIKFIDAKNNLSNFEATNGHIVSTTWLLQSSAISSIALKNKTYLDTLSSKQLYAQCLADLQLAYLMKNGYDEFSDIINNKIFEIDARNINALMYNNNIATIKFKQLQKTYSNLTKENMKDNPILFQAQKQMEQAQQRVKDLGYQDMPKVQYIRWLRSIEAEKARRQQRIKKEE